MTDDLALETVWNSFYDKHGIEPKNANSLHKFTTKQSTLNSNIHQLKYKEARLIFKKYAGKGRIIHLQDTKTNIINSLNSVKVKRNANLNKHNILELISSFKLQFLVSGFIQNMDRTFIYVIPSVIYDLCLSYCDLVNLVVLINENKQIYIADLVHNKKWKCVLNDSDIDNKSIKWSLKSGICYKQCVNIPKQINNVYKNANNTRADIIFQCQRNYCNAILFDFTQLTDTMLTDFNLFEYDLPLCNIDLCGNQLVFNERIGLYSIGGGRENYPYSRRMYQLKWNDMDPNEWKWNKQKDVQFDRGGSSSLIIDDNKIMIISGITIAIDGRYPNIVRSYRYQSSVEMYDTDTNQSVLLTSLHQPRFGGGSCYESCVNRVYLGGGIANTQKYYNESKHVEWYDTIKNQWYNGIPNTNKNHPNYPILWTQNNGDLLFCASMRSKIVEFIDLRVHNTSWDVTYRDNVNKKGSLIDMFNKNNGRLLK